MERPFEEYRIVGPFIDDDIDLSSVTGVDGGGTAVNPQTPDFPETIHSSEIQRTGNVLDDLTSDG